MEEVEVERIETRKSPLYQIVAHLLSDTNER